MRERREKERERLPCRFDAVTSIPVSWLDWGLDQVLFLFSFCLDRGISPLSFCLPFVGVAVDLFGPFAQRIS